MKITGGGKRPEFVAVPWLLKLLFEHFIAYTFFFGGLESPAEIENKSKAQIGSNVPVDQESSGTGFCGLSGYAEECRTLEEILRSQNLSRPNVVDFLWGRPKHRRVADEMI